MIQKYYNQNKFAQLCGVSKSAINQAVIKKSIYIDENGIDPTHKTNKKYIRNCKLKTGNSLRSLAAKKDKLGHKNKASRSVERDMVLATVGNVNINVPSSEFEGNPNDTNEVIALRYMAARTSKIEQEDLKLKLQNARLRGELLDKEAVYDGVILYLDKLNSNLERMAGTFLQDVAYKIINAEELKSDVRQEWIDSTLKQIDNAKNVIVKRLKKIAENQK